jgi:hypothetical protein
VRLRGTYRLLVAAACAAVLVGACGSDDEGEPIPAPIAQNLELQLDSIRGRFEFGGPACNDVFEADDNNVDPVEDALNQIPDDVDPEVRDALVESFERLFRLVEEQCDTEAETETEEEPVEPLPPPETETTETVPPETETEEEPEPVEPPEDDDDNGNGNGNGNGRGPDGLGPPGEGGGIGVPEGN